MKLIRFFGLTSLLVGSAFGASITGQLWTVPDSVAQNASLASIPNVAPNVTFQISGPLNFNSNGTVNDFLLSGGATNITGSATDLNNSISASLIELSGVVSVTSGQSFTVTHDDGLTLQIGGTSVLDFPGPSGPLQTNQTYTGPSGTLPFTLVYGECCAGSAVLQVDLPFQAAATPEPVPFLTMAGGMAFLLVLRRRRRIS